MNRLSFSQKNDLTVKHKSKKDFGKDLELFKKHFPSNSLMNDLARANDFSFERLDGQMLYLMLDKIPIEEILDNREGKQDDYGKEHPINSNPRVLTIDEKLKALEENNDFNGDEILGIQNTLEDQSTSIEELQEKIEDLEKKAFNKKKVSQKSSPQ